MVFMGSSEKGRSAFMVDMRSYENRQLTSFPYAGFEVVAPKSRQLFFLSDATVYSTNLDTLQTREVATVPAHYGYGRGFTVNSDETLLAGCYCRGEEKYYDPTIPRKRWIRAVYEAKLPNALYTIDIRTGEVNEFYHENEWLGHVQFSPTDPTLLEFCHEGPERELDRMWLVRTDGTDLRKVYDKRYARELVTHEFWSPDGARIWSDLQRDRSIVRVFPFLKGLLNPTFNLASSDIRTLETHCYSFKPRYSSWHYNASPDGRKFCGDGEGRYFRLCPSGKWIFLYRIEDGELQTERLCSMARHSWRIAPNTHFTPDGKWVVFQSDAEGTSQVYAVSVRPERVPM